MLGVAQDSSCSYARITVDLAIVCVPKGYLAYNLFWDCAGLANYVCFEVHVACRFSGKGFTEMLHVKLYVYILGKPVLFLTLRAIVR